MIKQKSGAQKRKKRVVKERLRCRVQQRQKNFGIVGKESKRKKSCKNAPDQETANKVLNVSESSPGNDIAVSYANLSYIITSSLGLHHH